MEDRGEGMRKWGERGVEERIGKRGGEKQSKIGKKIVIRGEKPKEGWREKGGRGDKGRKGR